MTATQRLHETIAAYNDAWNAHDVDRIGSMHAPDMVFENHTAGERAEGAEALRHIARIFESWPDIAFETRRLYVREDLVVEIGPGRVLTGLVKRIVPDASALALDEADAPGRLAVPDLTVQGVSVSATS